MLEMLVTLLALFTLAGTAGLAGYWLEHNPNTCTGARCILTHGEPTA